MQTPADRGRVKGLVMGGELALSLVGRKIILLAKFSNYYDREYLNPLEG